MLLAGGLENAQAFLAKALEAVGAGSRLESASAEDVGTGGLDLAGDVVENLSAFNSARSRMTPMMVRCSPRLRWALKPSSLIRSMT
jgi:hypothetical protein